MEKRGSIFLFVRVWLDGLRTKRNSRLETQQRKEKAMHQALIRFQELYKRRAIDGFVLGVNSDEETIVRVMYMQDRIPPSRAWFAVSRDGSEIRELSFDVVAELEAPWR